MIDPAARSHAASAPRPVATADRFLDSLALAGEPASDGFVAPPEATHSGAGNRSPAGRQLLRRRSTPAPDEPADAPPPAVADPSSRLPSADEDGGSERSREASACQTVPPIADAGARAPAMPGEVPSTAAPAVGPRAAPPIPPAAQSLCRQEEPLRSGSAVEASGTDRSLPLSSTAPMQRPGRRGSSSDASLVELEGPVATRPSATSGATLSPSRQTASQPAPTASGASATTDASAGPHPLDPVPAIEPPPPDATDPPPEPPQGSLRVAREEGLAVDLRLADAALAGRVAADLPELVAELIEAGSEVDRIDVAVTGGSGQDRGMTDDHRERVQAGLTWALPGRAATASADPAAATAPRLLERYA